MDNASETDTGSRALEGASEVIQLGLVVRDLDATIRAYRRVLGWGPWKMYDFRELAHHSQQYRGRAVDYSMRIATMSVGGIFLEIIQPVGPGPYQDFIDQRGEGMHHIQLKSPDNTALRDTLDGYGVPRLMSGTVDIDDVDCLDYVLHDTTDQLHLLVETVVGDRMKLIGLPAAVVTGDEEIGAGRSARGTSIGEDKE